MYNNKVYNINNKIFTKDINKIQCPYVS